MIAIASPYLSGQESASLNECLMSAWISDVGHFIPDVEHTVVDNPAGTHGAQVGGRLTGSLAHVGPRPMAVRGYPA